MSNSKYSKLKPEEPEEPDFRIVLIGKTGAGKSATGNTILGKTDFKSEMSPSTVTQACQKETAEVDGRTLAVVDTPGLFDTDRPQEKVKKDFVTSISLAAPGPHVFLVVIRPDRFTPEEQQALKIIQDLFGKEAECYTMVLFTRGDELKAHGVSIETFIDKKKDLRDFVRQCHGRYQVFNNRDDDPSQVHELLKKISTMVQKNGGSYYTNEKLQENERAIKAEMERLQREYPDLTLSEARKRAEKDNGFIQKLLKCLYVGGAIGGYVGSPIGVAVETVLAAEVGAAVGFVGGPVGAAVGAAVGAGIAVAGLAVATAVKKRKDSKKQN